MKRTAGALLIILMAACGGDDAVDGGPVTLDELPDVYADVFCARLIECSVLGALILTQTTCDTFSYEFRNDGAVLLQDGVDDGTIVYDAEAMGACLEALSTVACEELALDSLNDLPACEGAIVGQVGDGDACSHSLQCAPGLFCDTGLACPGTCAPRVASGESCADGESCAAGLACGPDDLCGPPLGDGADCAEGECPSGYVCSETTETCAPITHAAGEGAACEPNEGTLCAGALICTAEEADAFVCRARSSLGGACFVGVPNPCPPDSYCSAAEVGIEGTCEAVPQIGEPCRLDGGLFDLQCAGGAVCNETTEECVAVVDNGGACTVDEECVHGCDGTCQGPDPCP